jgi:hypothetical protein
MGDAQLVLVVTASYAGAVGFGEVYDCRVRERIVGALDEDTIRLTVLAGDKDQSAFLGSHPPPQVIELGFVMRRKGEPYRLAPISGFVDEEHTSWEITSMREAGG